jgi:hypothetical protein
VIAAILIAVASAVPFLILGLAALIGGRPEDRPAIMSALARGAEAGTVPGGPAIVVAAESVQAGGQGSNRNPLPAGQRAHYNHGLLPENLIRDLTRTDRDPAWPLILAQLAERKADPLACDAALAAAVAAQAAAQVLAFIRPPRRHRGRHQRHPGACPARVAMAPQNVAASSRLLV